MKAVLSARWTSIIERYIRLAGWLPILGGLFVLWGWQTHGFPNALNMRPLTALMFILAGGALVLLNRDGRTQWLIVIGRILAGFTMLIGGVVLAEYWLGVNLGVDLWLFEPAVLTIGGAFPGRPAPAVALSFLFLGAALWNLHRKATWLGEVLVALVLIICTLILVGYFYGVTSLYGLDPHGSTTLYLTLLLMMLGLGTFWASPNAALFEVFVSDRAGGASARRLVPAAILTPFILGWLDLQGELMNLYDERLGLALYATSTITVLVGLVLINARSLNQADLRRAEVLAALREMEARYRTIVEQTPAIVYVDEIGGNWRYISPQVERMLGYSADELFSDPDLWKRRIHPEDVHSVATQITASRETGSPLIAEYRFFHKSGRTVWLRDEALVIRDTDSDKTLLRGVMSDITAQKQFEEQLQYQAYLLDNVNDAIVASDENYILTAWNSAAEKMYGWQADEVLGRLGVNILRTEFPEGKADELRQHIAETGSYIGEATQQRKDGRRIHVEIASIGLRDQTGKFTGYVSVNRDITDRKQAEQQFFLAVESAPNAIILTDQTGKIVMVNPQAAQYFGYARGELIDLDIDQLVPERLRRFHSGFRSDFFNAPQTRPMGSGRELFGLRRDGTEFPVEIGLTPIDTLTEMLVMATIVDITERKQAETNLRASEARYHNVLDTMLEGCQIISPDWRYLYINEAGARHGHARRAELLGRSMLEIYPGIERTELFKVLQHCMALRTSHRMENEFVFPDGGKGWFELSIQPVPEGIFILSSDITPRKQAAQAHEARLVLEAKNVELDRFAYTVSHDLRSPLVTILTYIGFLRKDLATERLDRIQNDLNGIESAVTKMQALLTGVLTLARAGLSVKEPEQLNFRELVDETLELLRGALEASRAQTVIQPELPIVWGDRLRLRQVVQNLVENAIKYRHSERPLTIEIGMRSTDHKGHPILFVRDNGNGIQPEFQEHIFELFGKVAEETSGSGVGLATVKRIVEVHGGRLWVESEAGVGSTFLFTLPSQPKLDSVL